MVCAVCGGNFARALSVFPVCLQVRVWFQNKQHFAGSYEEEAAAARAYDTHVLSLAGPTARTVAR